jgi:acyl-coenzyme A thioesterase PaaI-like protein
MRNIFSKFSSASSLAHDGWERLSKIPGGKKIFSFLVSQYIPYTGSISPQVVKIEDGNAVVTIQDRHAFRNHLKSIHAIAIANLGEFTTGLSVISQLKNREKAIIVKLEIEYLKKARGELRAESFSKLPEISNDTEVKVISNIKNHDSELVAIVTATWRIRP